MERRFAIAATAALALALAGCTAGTTPGAASAAGLAHVEPFALEVGGQRLTGLLGVPADPAPATLVVLGHPWLTGSDTFAADLQRLADGGVLAVALDYRGPTEDFKVKA